MSTGKVPGTTMMPPKSLRGIRLLLLASCRPGSNREWQGVLRFSPQIFRLKHARPEWNRPCIYPF